MTELIRPMPTTSTATALSNDDMWTAVHERNPRYDGAFVFAVDTTGIYCRPSCPARRPRRAHVRFFSTSREAKHAGFRACRRCRPDAAVAPVAQRMRQACAYIEAHVDEPVSLAQLAQEVDLSPSHLQRTFKQHVGLSPKAYQHALRLGRFRERVKAGDTVLEATYEAGFGSSRGLYEQAHAGLGMTPGVYRRGGRGVSIRYTTAATPFGPLLVAATDHGICAVSLGDDAAHLERELAREFPAATIERDDAALQAWSRAIVRYLEGEPLPPGLPVDLEGTDFQRRVWQALRAIPHGETRSYGDLAAALGQPSAGRAVAQACARNRVALLVPCHRVVPKGGGTGGYRWGPERKKRLLELER